MEDKTQEAIEAMRHYSISGSVVFSTGKIPEEAGYMLKHAWDLTIVVPVEIAKLGGEATKKHCEKLVSAHHERLADLHFKIAEAHRSRSPL